MQVAEPVKTLNGQGQGDQQQSSEQQAVGMMMAAILQTATILGVVKTLVLDLGQPKQGTAAQPARGEILQPISFDHLAADLVLAITQDADGGPTQRQGLKPSASQTSMRS